MDAWGYHPRGRTGTGLESPVAEGSSLCFYLWIDLELVVKLEQCSNADMRGTQINKNFSQSAGSSTNLVLRVMLIPLYMCNDNKVLYTVIFQPT